MLPRLAPVVADDDPVRLAIAAPLVVAEISNTPEPDDVTPEDAAIVPVVSARVPAEIAVVPVKIFAAVSVVVPAPICEIPPVPLMIWPIDSASDRLNAKMPLSVMLDELAIVPAVLPAPMVRVPAVIVVTPV